MENNESINMEEVLEALKDLLEDVNVSEIAEEKDEISNTLTKVKDE